MAVASSTSQRNTCIVQYRCRFHDVYYVTPPPYESYAWHEHQYCVRLQLLASHISVAPSRNGLTANIYSVVEGIINAPTLGEHCFDAVNRRGSVVQRTHKQRLGIPRSPGLVLFQCFCVCVLSSNTAINSIPSKMWPLSAIGQ